jgi:nitrogen fixation protein NifQ
VSSVQQLERKVTDFLRQYAIDLHTHREIAPHIARVSLMPNHLYEDLGFKNRTEMGRYMKEHFPKLAFKKPDDKLWKKFIYDSIDEVAPACATCSDRVHCFSCRV